MFSSGENRADSVLARTDDDPWDVSSRGDGRQRQKRKECLHFERKVTVNDRQARL